MTDDADFTDAFCEFLQFSVTAVDAAELLLLLHENPDRAWTPQEVVAKLQAGAGLTEGEAARYLDVFQARGLLAREDSMRVRYSPATPDLDAHVRMLAKLYNERPVTLIRVIYGLRDMRIKSFADAFKFRRK